MVRRSANVPVIKLRAEFQPARETGMENVILHDINEPLFGPLQQVWRGTAFAISNLRYQAFGVQPLFQMTIQARVFVERLLHPVDIGIGGFAQHALSQIEVIAVVGI